MRQRVRQFELSIYHEQALPVIKNKKLIIITAFFLSDSEMDRDIRTLKKIQTAQQDLCFPLKYITADIAKELKYFMIYF